MLIGGADPDLQGSAGDGAMTEPSITIRPETADDAVAIERLHERTFGPGRLAKTAYRIREGAEHQLALSFTARIGTLMIGSVRLTPIRIGAAKALLLGPLTVEPPFRARGIGGALIARALAEAKAKGHRLGRAGGRRALLRQERIQADSQGTGGHAGAGRSGAGSGLRAGRGRVCRRLRPDPPDRDAQ